MTTTRKCVACQILQTRNSLAIVLWLGVVGLCIRPALADVTFLGDWADFGSQFQREGFRTRWMDGQAVEWLAGKGPNHWSTVQERGEDRLRVEQDPSSPRSWAVLRVEVRPGDNVGYTGERAEVSHMLGPRGEQYPVTVESGHEVYGLAVKLDPNWQAPLHDDAHGHWRYGNLLQLHSPDVFSSPPAFALAVEDEFHVNVLAGDLIDASGKRRDGQPVKLANGELRQGRWVEFLIDVVWAYDNQGALTIYRRDEGERKFSAVANLNGVPTLQFDSQIPDSKKNYPLQFTHYWKLGYYRSISKGVTSRLWLGPMVRGNSLQEVSVAAFGSGTNGS